MTEKLTKFVFPWKETIVVTLTGWARSHEEVVRKRKRDKSQLINTVRP